MFLPGGCLGKQRGSLRTDQADPGDSQPDSESRKHSQGVVCSHCLPRVMHHNHIYLDCYQVGDLDLLDLEWWWWLSHTSTYTIRQWRPQGVREKHKKARGSALVKLAGMAAIALPRIMGSVVSWFLNIMGKQLGGWLKPAGHSPHS